jgi:hypothetical protein
MGRGGVEWAHLVKHDPDSSFRQKPGGLGSGKTRSNNMNFLHPF